jgi:hypothetical protein
MSRQLAPLVAICDGPPERPWNAQSNGWRR